MLSICKTYTIFKILSFIRQFPLAKDYKNYLLKKFSVKLAKFIITTQILNTVFSFFYSTNFDKNTFIINFLVLYYYF